MFTGRSEGESHVHNEEVMTLVIESEFGSGQDFGGTSPVRAQNEAYDEEAGELRELGREFTGLKGRRCQFEAIARKSGARGPRPHRPARAGWAPQVIAAFRLPG